MTLNAGSNDVSVISDLSAASPVVQSISTGGTAPTAAFAVPILSSGLESLVVANNGDGLFSLMNPGAEGLTLAATTSAPGLPNPSALALASFSGGGVEFYAASEGVEAASVVGFELATANPGSGPSVHPLDQR